ncbi:hypothetical protein [Amycolatopsis plumensis]
MIAPSTALITLPLTAVVCYGRLRTRCTGPATSPLDWLWAPRSQWATTGC